MAKPVKVMVLTGNGINCERETAYACTIAGADRTDMVSLWDWAAGRVSVREYGLICFPGGFLDGDDLGAAKACAARLRHTRSPLTGRFLVDELVDFVESGGLILGICNGFQLLVKLGLLPSSENRGLRPELVTHGQGGRYALKQLATLTFNDRGRFEDRWVTLKGDPHSPCIFTRGIGTLDLPVRHGEGKLILEESSIDFVRKNHHIPLYYVDPVTYEPTERYPYNPNGSPGGAAALCDATGRILGLMPHPECFLSSLNHPDWTRIGPWKAEEGGGLTIFRNAVNYLRDG